MGVQGFSPLSGQTARSRRACAEIGARRGKSVSQVALRWVVQSGAAFVTQSKSAQHFREDLDIFNFELSPEEMALLDGLTAMPPWERMREDTLELSRALPS